MNEESPAMVAARASWSAVQRKAKEEWLALMADDVVFQDPIGVSPLDSTGKGSHRSFMPSRFLGFPCVYEWIFDN